MVLSKIHEDPEIYKIKVPLPKNPLRDLNVYVVISEGEALLVDTGFRLEECREALLEGIRQLGIPWEKIKLFVTHMHSDHAGQTDIFTEHGCPVYMSTKDIQWLNRVIHDEQKSYISVRLEAHGFPDCELREARQSNPMYAFAPFSTLKFYPVTDGYIIRVGNIRACVVETHGHTPGHACLYLESSGIIFAGDHILYDITPNISVWTGIEDSLGDYIHSLMKVNMLPFTVAYPAHRELRGSPHGRIQELLNHHKERLNEALWLVAKHPGSTGYEIASYMKWSVRAKDWSDFPVSQKWFAVGETIAHLDWLMLRGYVRFEKQNNVYYIYPLKEKLVDDVDLST